MEKIKGKIIIIVILLLCLLVFSGCIKRNTQQTILDHQVDNNTEITTVNEKITPTLMPEEECKNITIEEVLRNAINDDIWFEGKNRSFFKKFEMQDFNVEIYKNVDIPEEIWVIFYNKNENDNTYYLALFEVDSLGILNEPKKSIVEKDYNKAIERMRNYDFSLERKTEIQIGEVQQPNYTGMTEEKKKIVDEIEILVKEEIKIWKLEPGAYRMYIRDFRCNSKKTYVAIKHGSEYRILDIYLYTHNYIAAERFYLVDNEVTQRWIELIKKTVLYEKKIIVE